MFSRETRERVRLFQRSRHFASCPPWLSTELVNADARWRAGVVEYWYNLFRNRQASQGAFCRFGSILIAASPSETISLGVHLREEWQARGV